MGDRVLVSVEDHVAHVRLNRPEKRNGLDLQMFEALAMAVDRVASEPGVRVAVLSGEGKAFCAGLDWASFLTMADRAIPALLDRRTGALTNLAQKVSVGWAMGPVPVIAAVHGAALGGGLQIALGADLRYVTPDAQLSVMEVRYGLIPDMGLSVLLPRLVRADTARELTLTGRVFDGVEAERLGLATRVCDDPLATAMETARVIAANAPRAVRAARRLLRDAPLHDVAASLALESELQRSLLGTPEQMEAVRAVLEKRAGRFDDP
jgi:enoyl-CoA hydratase/carnithine racemase